MLPYTILKNSTGFPGAAPCPEWAHKALWLPSHECLKFPPCGKTGQRKQTTHCRFIRIRARSTHWHDSPLERDCLSRLVGFTSVEVMPIGITERALKGINYELIYEACSSRFSQSWIFVSHPSHDLLQRLLYEYSNWLSQLLQVCPVSTEPMYILKVIAKLIVTV